MNKHNIESTQPHYYYHYQALVQDWTVFTSCSPRCMVQWVWWQLAVETTVCMCGGDMAASGREGEKSTPGA